MKKTIKEAEKEAHKINMAECNGILIERKRIIKLINKYIKEAQGQQNLMIFEGYGKTEQKIGKEVINLLKELKSKIEG